MANKEKKMEDYQKFFNYCLKGPDMNNSLQKYLLYTSNETKKHSAGDFLEENYNKFEKTLNNSDLKEQFQRMTYELNTKDLKCTEETTMQTNAETKRTKLTKATGIAKNFTPQTSNDKFKQQVEAFMETKCKNDVIENYFKTTQKEIQKTEVIKCAKTVRNQEIRREESSSSIETVQDFESDFRTAKEELKLQKLKKHGSVQSVGGQKRKLGGRRAVQGKFISPVLSNSDIEEPTTNYDENCAVDERLKNIDPKMVDLIRSEIMDNGPTINWDDIAGLDFAKTSIQEAVVWPMLRPDIFTGLRRPPKAILLFGPPGTGKTLIGKCVASQSKSTFFSISASSLTSKWIGDGEKMVRALFSVARCHQPAVIFIDEIDSLLSQRSDTEHESSRRIKTEFLVQLDGATTDSEERLLVIGATNRPQELDEAARRRFVKRLYIPLPVLDARRQLVKQLVKNEKHLLSEDDLKRIAVLSDGYSGADLKNLCCEAALGPIRCMDLRLIETISAADVRPISMDDFESAFQRVKSSVAEKDLEQLITWNKTYGSNNGC